MQKEKKSMKRLMIIMVVLSAFVLGMACACADEADFISDWANTESGLKADIVKAEGGLNIAVESYFGEPLYYWQYTAAWDEGKNALVATGGSKTVVVWENGGRSFGETVYTDGSAEFTINEEGQLVWADLKEDAGKDQPMVDIGSFEGTWTHDNVSIKITWSDLFYDVWITWPQSKTEEDSWMLRAIYDAENKALNGYGTKTHMEYNENGDVVSAEELNEEVNAEFTIVEEGKMNWRDDDEGIDEMIFELQPDS